LPRVSSSGLTVGTTTITGGTNTRILYNNNGVVGEYAVTGTGTTAVLGTSPTITNLGINKTSPVYFLDILSDSQTGTEAISFRYHAGATSGSPQMFFEKARGTLATPTALLSNDDIGYLSWRGHTGSAFTGTRAAIYCEASENWSPTANGTQITFSVTPNTTSSTINAVRILQNGNLHILNTTSYLHMGSAAPTTSNYKIQADGTNTLLNGNSAVYIRTGDNSYNNAIFNTTSTVFTCSTIGSGANTNFTFTVPTNTNQTATTNIPNFRVTGSTKQWATGTVSLQYFNWFSANTVGAVGASTFTHVSNFRSDAPLQGTNATATNLYAIDCGGHMFIANSVGVPSNNPTGGGILYVEAGALKYRGSSGTVTTIANA